MIEHLYALHAALEEQVPIKGYIHWTLTDNFEWADGYCPRFGLIGIDRETMKRTPKESFYSYQKIIKENSLSQSFRERKWIKVKEKFNKKRKTCRHQNGKDGLNIPREMIFKPIDWRFKLIK